MQGASVPEPLDTRDAISLLDGIRRDAEPSGLTFSGGEPLLRKDLTELVEHAASIGIPGIAIATNGTLLTETSARRLHDAGAHHFEVSLPTTSPAVYRRLCGREGPGKAMGAIRACVSAGASVTVSLILAEPTLSTAGDVVSVAFALGARGVVLNRFTPAAAVDPGTARDLLPAHDDLMEAARVAGSRGLELGIPVYTGIPLEPCLFDHGLIEGVDCSPCVCAHGKWAVDPSGRLRPCEQSPQVLGSLMEEPFSRLSKRPGVDLFLADTRAPECGTCGMFDICGGGCRFAARTN